MSFLHSIARDTVQMENQPVPSHSQSRYQRSELQDVQKAIDLLFKFKEELNKLHPAATDCIAALLKSPY